MRHGSTSPCPPALVHRPLRLGAAYFLRNHARFRPPPRKSFEGASRGEKDRQSAARARGTREKVTQRALCANVGRSSALVGGTAVPFGVRVTEIRACVTNCGWRDEPEGTARGARAGGLGAVRRRGCGRTGRGRWAVRQRSGRRGGIYGGTGGLFFEGRRAGTPMDALRAERRAHRKVGRRRRGSGRRTR